MSDAAVILQDVGVQRGRVRILQRINARISARELVGIVGPNGAGKTTLMRLLNGLIRPSSGSVSVLGTPIETIRGGVLARLRRRIGHVPQLSDAAGSVPIRVREVIAMGRSGRRGLIRRLSPADHAITRRWMQRLGIAHLAERLYRDLSGGEQRKTHLARALSQEPEILLLDEPTSNLDARWQEELSTIIEDIWQELRLTVFFVTHEMRLLPPSATRVMLLSGGRLHGNGPPAETLTPARLTKAFGVPVEVLERGGRRHLIIGAGPRRGAWRND